MKIKTFILCLTSLFFLSAHSSADQNFLPIPLINRDDKLLKITSKNFKIINTTPNLNAVFVGKIKWERTEQNLLLPYLKIRLKTQNDEKAHLHYFYKGVTYLPQINGSEEFTDLDFSVFDTTRIEVFHEGTKVGEIGVSSFPDELINKTVLIDFSCSGYNLQISGFDGEFLSLGCEMRRESINGVVIPTLNVNWISSEYKTLDLHPGPYVISFSEGREARVLVLNDSGDRKEIHFKVNFPKRLHRLRMSAGFGPYVYKNSKNDQSQASEILPSMMVYGNYYLNNIHSLKFFEALVMKNSIFNHAGLYLGSELGKFYDDRLVISSLIGFQSLTYQFDRNNDAFTQIIFPQGVELTMHHPFGLEDSKFSLGGFLSPQSNITYQNFWARFGSKVFVEFNYINWVYGTREAAMYGLSVGFPILQAF